MLAKHAPAWAWKKLKAWQRVLRSLVKQKKASTFLIRIRGIWVPSCNRNGLHFHFFPMRSLLARQLKLQGSWKRFSMINFSTFQFLVVWTPSLKAQWVLEKGFGLGGPRVHVLRTRPTASMVWNQIWSPKVLLIFPADSAVSAEKELCRENPRLACNVPCTANRYLNWTYFELMSTNLRASSGLTNCWPKHFLLSDISLICAHCQVDVILSVINSEMRSISVVKIQSSGVWLYIIIYNITILYNRTIIYICILYI